MIDDESSGMRRRRARRFRGNLRIERDNAALYARLAELATDARLGHAYRRIAAGEQTNAEFWEARLREMSEAADRALDSAKLRAADVDLLIPHQANTRIIEATAKHANISMDKVYVNVDRFGNTSSASIPIAIDECIESGKIKEGSLVLLTAFGGGVTWGGTLIRF